MLVRFMWIHIILKKNVYASLFLPLQRRQPARHFLRVGAAVERADAEIALAFRAKTAAGRDDHVGFAQNFVERLPARDAFGAFTQM